MYCKRPDTQERTVCSLVGKQMNIISGSMSISQDQTQFQAAGGVLKRNSCGTPRKCSVSKQTLDTLTHYDEQIADQNLNDNEDKNQKTRITFQWHNITRQYKAQPQELSTVNLYQYSSVH